MWSVRLGWGKGIRSPGTQDLLPDFLSGQEQFLKGKTTTTTTNGQGEKTQHGSPKPSLLLPFLPSAPAAAVQMPVRLTLTLTDKPHLLSLSMGLPSLRYLCPCTGHTQPCEWAKHISQTCAICAGGGCEYLGLALVLWRLSMGFFYFGRGYMRLNHVLSPCPPHIHMLKS